MSVNPLRAKVPRLKVGADSGPLKSLGPEKMAPPPPAPPAVKNVTGPLSVLPSNVTVIGLRVNEVPETNEAGVGDAAIDASNDPVICGLVKVNKSIVAARAAAEPSASDTARAATNLDGRSIGISLVDGLTIDERAAQFLAVAPSRRECL